MLPSSLQEMDYTLPCSAYGELVLPVHVKVLVWTGPYTCIFWPGFWYNQDKNQVLSKNTIFKIEFSNSHPHLKKAPHNTNQSKLLFTFNCWHVFLKGYVWTLLSFSLPHPVTVILNINIIFIFSSTTAFACILQSKIKEHLMCSSLNTLVPMLQPLDKFI
jgi:hypothetical protein